MNRPLLAALALSTFAGCTSVPPTPEATGSSTPNRTTSFEARAGTASDRIFEGEPGPQVQAKYAHDPAGHEDGAFRREQTKALSGDREAMFRIAQMFRQGSNGVTRDEGRMVSWLRQASEQGHKVASYQLYLHYVDRGLDRHAIHYEKLALRQGYVLPERLDPRRG